MSVMGEPKAFASLSSGLLARKGAARPAMRPQGFGQVGAGLEDLGWNDMGFEAPKPSLTPVRDDQHDAFGAELSEPALRNPLAALTPVASPVHDQQAEIADRFADYTEESSDEEYVDETAELYDPEADEALAVAAAEVEEQEEEALVLDAPLLSVKPSRVIVPANETEAAQAPVLAAPVAAPAPVASAPVAAVRNAAPRQPRQRAAAGSKAKAAFTLRLDAARHLKLRLACAVSGRSAQQLVTEALDQLLDAMPDVQAMADRAPDKRASR
jgi:hypothetical protein